eukprot:5640172-Pyramimonas_sp.AAC.1
MEIQTRAYLSDEFPHAMEVTAAVLHRLLRHVSEFDRDNLLQLAQEANTPPCMLGDGSTATIETCRKKAVSYTHLTLPTILLV